MFSPSIFSHRRLARNTIFAATVALASFGPSPARAATLGADSAANYATWTNGSTGGTGFSTWDLTSNNNNGTTIFAGYFLGDSTAGSGNINTSAKSFGMFANPTSGAFANATRTFSGGVLTLGQTFSIQLAVNFRNGDKGINLFSGANQIFNFDIGQSNTGTDGYYYKIGTGTATSTGFAYFSDSVFTLSYTQQSATAGLFSIGRTSATGGAAATNAMSIPFTASGASSFTLYNSNANNANGDNLYFNNLQVVPEPSTMIVSAVSLTVLLVGRRRRRDG